MSLFNIELKKGKNDELDGRLTVYARVNIDPEEMLKKSHPVSSMVNNDLLVAQGNYKEQNNLKDFLKSEMGLSFEKGLSEFLDRIDGIESALDPEKLKEKMGNIDELQDYIPTPAKLVPFHSEEEIISQEGDVYFAGHFENVANANLFVNSFPILYQARFREQQMGRVKNEIENIINQIESSSKNEENFRSSESDIKEKILKEYVSNMIYCKKNRNAFNSAKAQFKSFMRGYRFEEDVQKIIFIISETEKMTSREYRLLELYATKISEITHENFTDVENIRKEIELIEKSV